MKYDVLIIGSGIAGLYAGINIPKNRKVLILSKENPWSCNSFYAQGGIATAINKKDIKSHTEDTIKVGSNYNNQNIVNMVSSSSIEIIQSLIDDGMKFDLDKNNKLLYTKEAGHSTSRIIHAGGDATGRYIHNFMMKKYQYYFKSNAIVYNLIIKNGHCHGVRALIDSKKEIIIADNIIIATGGIGSLYENNTNDNSISGDLQGICIEHKIKLSHMEMLQFHPTVFMNKNSSRQLLLTEALRGEGAHIVDKNGKRFLFDYSKDGELSSRDIVSRAIFQYTEKTKLQAYLDLSMFDKIYFKSRFPNIYKIFLELNFNLPEDLLPISPSFHYAIGGIEVDINGSVSGFSNLYAIGEVAYTGLHGANRLASNSLLEGVVFAKRSVNHILSKKQNNQSSLEFIKKSDNKILYKKNDKKYKNKIRNIMWNKVGIIKKTDELLEAKLDIIKMQNMSIGWLLKIRLNSALSIIDSAIKRRKSLGAHYKI